MIIRDLKPHAVVAPTQAVIALAYDKAGKLLGVLNGEQPNPAMCDHSNPCNTTCL